jgi:tRNA(Phe) wybutosine-synthesizing methylase Tyw3
LKKFQFSFDLFAVKISRHFLIISLESVKINRKLCRETEDIIQLLSRKNKIGQIYETSSCALILELIVKKNLKDNFIKSLSAL